LPFHGARRTHPIHRRSSHSLPLHVVGSSANCYLGLLFRNGSACNLRKISTHGLVRAKSAFASRLPFVSLEIHTIKRNDEYRLRNSSIFNAQRLSRLLSRI